MRYNSNLFFIIFLSLFFSNLSFSANEESIYDKIDLFSEVLDKVNNEYYMDIVAKYAQKLGYKVNYCLVNNYKSFGTLQNIKF